MVHHADHRHSSYYPSTTSFSHNKNYQQQQQHQKSGATRSGSLKKNNNNNNNGSSSPTCSSNPVNDNDTFVRFWPGSATGSTSLESSCHPCGVVNGDNDVRWSKLLRHDGTPSKVLLYPEEGWARTATNAYWLLSIPWWNRNRCKVVEVAGTRRSTTQAKLIDAGRGTVYVVGSFKNNNHNNSTATTATTTTNDLEPEFKLALTSHISPADVNLGYLMTGTLERGRQGDSLQPTHFAVLRKFDCNQ